MPGVTFIDVILRALASCGHAPSEIELRRLLFQEPLATQPGVGRALRVEITSGNGADKVSVASQRVTEAGVAIGGWVVHASCEVVPAQLVAVPRLEVAALVSRANRHLDLDEAYRVARNMRIEHGPFMKAEGAVHVGRDYVLVELSLSELARPYLEDFLLHPAFMDAATLPYSAFIFGQEEELSRQPYIPIYAERFRAWADLEERVHVLVSRQAAADTSQDVLYTDIEIFDSHGHPIASFRRLGAKKIRSPELITRLISGVAIVGGSSRVEPAATKTDAVICVARPAEPSTPRSEEALRVNIERRLRELVGAAIGRDPEDVDVASGFYDLGLESTDLLKLVRALEGSLGAELYPTLLFEYSTIRALAAYLALEHAQAFQERAESAAELVSTSAEAAVLLDAKPEVARGVGIYRTEWQAAPSQAQRPDLLDTLVIGDGPALEWVREGGLRVKGMLDLTATPVSSLGAGLGRAHTAAEPTRVVFADVALRAASDAVDEPLTLSALRPVFEYLALLARTPSTPVRLVYVSEENEANEVSQPVAAAVSALFRTAMVEAPWLDASVLSVPRSVRAELAPALRLELARSGRSSGVESRYRAGVLELRRLSEIGAAASAQQATNAAFRQGGVYLVSGGLGGLGLHLARHLSEHYDARLVLLGRQPASGAALTAIEALRQDGAHVSVVTADVRNLAAVQRAVRFAKATHRELHGVVHCAGTVRDGYLAKLDPGEALEALQAKARGALLLDYATREEELELFLLFSSLSAVLGNPGQGAYAAGNAFLDAFAVQRQRQVSLGLRSGHTLSVNWPLWRSGGMQPGAEAERVLTRATGLRPLETETGMAALETCVALGAPQLAVVQGGNDAVLRCLIELRPLAPHDSRPSLLRSVPREKDTSSPSPELAPAASSADIAIIGIDGRYPMAANLDQFWSNLRDGVDCISEIPESRWDLERFYDARRNVPGKCYARWGGFLNGVEEFDSLFFNIAPHEAELLDPQERLFLQSAWATLENAGYTREFACDSRASARRDVGVFVGTMWQEYQLLAVERAQAGMPIVAGGSSASIANRVSYVLDLHGPSVPVDTMCSSSLMAIHMACESLRRNECSLALAGGVNLSLHPSKYVKLAQMQMLSSDGRCRSFGHGGDGYVPGEGVGCLLLKPLARAVTDGDHIYAVIKGTHANHGGRTAGMTVPSPVAQGDLMLENFKKHGIDPRTISYVEAHGTGTALGDTIEVDGLMRAFGHFTQDQQFCALGSVKSNIGHLEAAAGIAAITKLVLQLKHRQLVPSLHAAESNEKIDFSKGPFKLQRELSDWLPDERSGLLRRATISSFGAGGVNVHLIVEEYPRIEPDPIARPELVVLPLSARTEPQLQEYAKRLCADLTAGFRQSPPISLACVAHTLQVGREAKRHRLAICATSESDGLEKLTAFCEGRPAPGLFSGDAKSAHGVGSGAFGAAGELASAWVRGRTVAWASLGVTQARRVPLTTYPFAPIRHWLPPMERVARDSEVALIPRETPRASVNLPRGDELLLAQSLVREALARELKMDPKEIEVDEPFDAYGVDSVIAAKLLSELELRFGVIPLAAMFERRSVNALASYFVENYPERLVPDLSRESSEAYPRAVHVAVG